MPKKLGNALLAPTLSFVPDGDFDPPTGFMRYHGAISVQPDTFKRLLADTATSLRVNGFEHVVVVSDHGGNMKLIRQVVDSLSAAWASSPATIHYVPEYIPIIRNSRHGSSSRAFTGLTSTSTMTSSSLPSF